MYHTRIVCSVMDAGSLEPEPDRG